MSKTIGTDQALEMTKREKMATEILAGLNAAERGYLEYNVELAIKQTDLLIKELNK